MTKKKTAPVDPSKGFESELPTAAQLINRERITELEQALAGRVPILQAIANEGGLEAFARNTIALEARLSEAKGER